MPPGGPPPAPVARPFRPGFTGWRGARDGGGAPWQDGWDGRCVSVSLGGGARDEARAVEREMFSPSAALEPSGPWRRTRRAEESRPLERRGTRGGPSDGGSREPVDQ